MLLAGDDSPVKFNFLRFDPIPLPLDPEVLIRGINPDKVKIFKVTTDGDGLAIDELSRVAFRVLNYLSSSSAKQPRAKSIRSSSRTATTYGKIN